MVFGGYALVFPLLLMAARGLSNLLPDFASSLGFLLDVILFALLVGPPTILMGATLPIASEACQRQLETECRRLDERG